MKKTHIVAILIVSLMLIAIVPSSVKAYTPLPLNAAIEPNPMSEGNVTFSNHTAGQATMQYVTQYGNTANLSAALDARTSNPVTINEADIVSPNVTGSQNKIGGAYWNKTSNWVLANNDGSAVTSSSTTYDGQNVIALQWNTSNEASASDFAGFQ